MFCASAGGRHSSIDGRQCSAGGCSAPPASDMVLAEPLSVLDRECTHEYLDYPNCDVS